MKRSHENDLPVVVLVMSEQCGACQNFKKLLPDIEKDLRKDNRFRFVVLDFRSMNIPLKEDGKDYHPGLKDGFVEYFPTFLMFPGTLWNDKQSKLKGVPKHNLKINSQVDYSKVSILSWITDTLKNNGLFSNIELKTRIPTSGTYNKFKSSRIAENF